MENWECHFCTALNSEDKPQCWKCGKARHDSEVARAPHREAAEAARQAALKQSTEARSTAVALANSGRLGFREYLAQHIGITISINVSDPVHADRALLLSTQADHFEVQQGTLHYRIPYTQILKITERTAVEASARAILVIEIFHLVVYKGSVGFGFSVPI